MQQSTSVLNTTQGQDRPTPATNPPSLEQIKAKMKATWEAGDYARFAYYMEPGARGILAGWGVTPGEYLLDVGCGAGQTAIPAAQAGACVCAIDIASNLIQAGRARAAQVGVDVVFEEGDAESIPYPDASFDQVISLIGAMFAPRPERVASEFARVCKPGARLHMANWTPTSLPGRMFKLAAQWVTPPPGIQRPVLWGDEDTVRERLSTDFTDIELTRRYYPTWKYPFSVTEVVDFFRTHFGPVHSAFSTLDEHDQRLFHQALTETFTAHNVASDGSVELQGEYLDVQAVRR